MKRLKLSLKLTIGFSVVITVLAALGATGYIMFGKVNANVDLLGQHILPTLQYTTGVERSAFETILEDRNYLLSSKEEISKRAQEKLAELISKLDKVEKKAAADNDAQLVAKTKEVKGIAAQYSELSRQGVTTTKSNTQAEKRMDDKSILLENEANTLLTARKADYLESKNALALINNLNAKALELRLYTKAYIVSQQEKDREAIEKNLNQLLEGYDQLEKMRPTQLEIDQITEARTAAQEYAAAAKAWIEEQKKDGGSEKLPALVETMEKTGETICKTIQEYLTAKETRVNKAFEAAFIVSGIVQEVLSTRLNEKAYIIYKDESYWTALNTHFQKLLKLYDDLRKLAYASEDRQMISKGLSATVEYLTAAKLWVANDKKLPAEM
ncbi:MAG: hypothetical protein HQK55_04540 [Deltaproteobacteria bacterium]|nr:hypothetical protein [Deltaproteobacteria bacterium]